MKKKSLARLSAIGKERRKKKKFALMHGPSAYNHRITSSFFSQPNLQYKPKSFLRCFARNRVYRSFDRFASIEFLVQKAENDAQGCGGNDGDKGGGAVDTHRDDCEKFLEKERS